MTLASPRRIARRRSLTTRAASCTKRAPLAHQKPKTRAARTVTRPALSRRDLRKLARNAGRRVASLAYDDTTTANDRRSSGRAPRPRARFDPALEAAKPQWDHKGGKGHVDVRARDDGGDRLQAVICAALPSMPAWHVSSVLKEPQSRSLVAAERGTGRVAGGLVFRRTWSSDAATRCDVVEVSFLAVSPEFRGRGVASKLVARVKALAAAEAAALVTHADNGAVAYWRRHGFEAASLQPAAAKWLNDYSDSQYMVLGGGADDGDDTDDETLDDMRAAARAAAAS